MSRVAALVVLTAGLAQPLLGGVYAYSMHPDYDAAIIVHPHLYTGTAGTIPIGVCLNPAAEVFIAEDLAYAVRVWNERIARTGNCIGPCRSPNEDQADLEPFHSYVISTLIHELGHAALGLAHVNQEIPLTAHFDWTASKDVDDFNDGTDDVPGSKDDSVTPFVSTLVVHWFRINDNNPLIVDSTTVINTSSYSRAKPLLPNSGSTWVASGNSRVANLLGYPNTQAVMTSSQPMNTLLKRLSADELNTVSFAEKGVHPQPTSPGDDYTYSLSIVPCDSAQIEVFFETFSPVSPILGISNPTITPLPGGTGNHYRLGTEGSDPRVKIRINAAPAFPFPDPTPDIPIFLIYSIFLDDFEIGNANNWSDTEP